MDLDLLRGALHRREAALARWHAEGTTCYRLFHGATEGVPGLAVDRYGPVLLVQTWRAPLEPGDLEAIAAVAGPDLVPVWNHRGRERGGSPAPELHDPVGTELGLAFDVRPRHRGIDPLLFLDLRAGRRRLRRECAGRTVLNLFSYTGGSAVAALAGGATEAWNVDFASSALEVAAGNAKRNGVDAQQRNIEEDVYPVVRQLAGLPVRSRRPVPYTRLEPRQFDVVVLDPPTWATSPFGAVDLVRDYPGVLKPALLATKPGGRLLVTNHVSTVDVNEWHAVVQRTAEKAGRPLADLEPIAPEEDFPSPDGRFPLKIAWLTVAG